MLSSIFVFLAVAVLIVVARKMLDGEDAVTDTRVYVKAIVIGLIVGAVNYFSPILEETMWMSWIFLAVMLGLFVWLCYWWKEEGGEWKEMAPFVALAVLFFFVAKAAASVTTAFFESDTAMTVMMILPTLFLIATIGYFVASHLWFLYSEVDKVYRGDDDKTVKAKKDKANLRKTLAMATGVITILALAFVCWHGIDWAAADSDVMADDSAYAAESAEDVGSVQPVLWEGITFYNQKLQEDNDVENNFNFGPDPWVKNENSADYYAFDFAERRASDPALLSATMLALDGTLGTDFIGQVLYTGYDERNNMLQRADAATRILAADKETFNNSNEAVSMLLSSATKVEVKKLSNLKDQLYMNPYTIDGIPSIVSYVSDFDEGWCLIYTFQIKKGSNTTQKVIFHIPCGYQWANGAEKIGVTPTEKPTTPKKPDNPSGPEPTPPGPGGGEGDPDGPQYHKDPSEAPSTDTEPNDDPGPGPSTNNPSDPSHSTQDTPDSSTHGSYQDYKDNINDLKDTNKNQKTGSDSNKPSTPKPSSNTNVDNNGDKGTGNGGANTPTPTKPKAKEADTGKDIDSSPGEAWEGPKD